MIELGLSLNKVNSAANNVNVLHPFENLKVANYLDGKNLEQFLFKNSFSDAARAIVVAAMNTIFALPLNQVNALFASM